jgi:hypothetical protein
MSRSAVADAIDPDYAALSSRQKLSIDKAFAKGVSKRGGKRRRIDGEAAGTSLSKAVGEDVEDAGMDGGFVRAENGGGGGFVVDEEEGGGFVSEGGGGGFMPEEEGVGGFLPENDDAGGGFLPEVPVSKTKATLPFLSSDIDTKLPLHRLPALLSSLGLPSDEDVLAVFRASATGWDEDSGKKRRDMEEELGVELKDFRAVCAALMGPEEEGVDGMAEDQGDESEGSGDDAYDAKATDSGSDSPLSSVSSNSSYASRSNKRKGAAGSMSVPKGKPTRSTRGKKALEAQSGGAARLSARQKEAAKDIWEMVKPEGKNGGRSAQILGRDEVRRLVRTLGEMWTEDEVSHAPLYLRDKVPLPIDLIYGRQTEHGRLPGYGMSAC